MNQEGKELQDVCSHLIEILKLPARQVQEYSWVGPTKLEYLEFTRRAAIVRQFEACEAIIKLIDAGSGSMGVTLLRPAYEELIWLDYLSKNESVALDLVTYIAQKELSDSYNAQKDFLGQKGIRNIGFTKRLSLRIGRNESIFNEKLKEIGKDLGWRNGALQPSVAFLARKVKREKQYRYLYQGTSRAVHFSPHELQRRVWGRHGEVKIASSNFDNYWSDFALSWSFRILIETIIFAGHIDTFVNHSELNEVDFTSLLRDLRPVQILTATELEAWDEPSITQFTRS